MFKYFKKRKDVKTAQAAYSQAARDWNRITQELEDAQKELKTLESSWMNGLDYGRSKRFDRVQIAERKIRNLKRAVREAEQTMDEKFAALQAARKA
ncbi:hypothetical protein [Turicimonas muris]|uniref:hypothetical protein n=1 Tax=Turicimonas muris TaxID=1796652 RepID=UPI00257353E2|nr:hypothetical protein [Turicimonas muris]